MSNFARELAKDSAYNSALRLIDRQALIEAARSIVGALESDRHFSAYRNNLLDTKRKSGTLPYRLERAFVQSHQKLVSKLEPAFQGVRSLLNQMEASGVNLVVSKYFQDSIVNGKLPLGELASEAAGLLNNVDEAVSEIATLGLGRGDLESALAVVTGIDREKLIDVNVILPDEIEQLAEDELSKLGYGKMQELRGGGSAGGAVGARVHITKGYGFIVHDLLTVTETTTTADWQTSVSSGVLSPFRSGGAPGPIYMGSTGGFLLGVAMMIAGLILGTSTFLGAGLVFIGILLMLDNADSITVYGMGFVDP